MASSIVIRCDGGDTVGAGHVSRCIPIAAALRERGADVRFAGDFDGVAAWMLARHAMPAEAPGDGPCGVDLRKRWSGAIVDLYLTGDAAICDLAAGLHVATIGESTRCAESGLWIDYHAGSAPGMSERRLGGAAFAPVDPRFAARRRRRTGVRRVLVMAGASTAFGDTPSRLADAAAAAFPDAEVVAPAAIACTASRAVTPLPTPFDLADVAPDIDLAVVAAGMTAYELASAGIPIAAVGLVENQRVVIDGCAATGIALPVDGIRQDPMPAVVEALARLQDPEVRTAVSERAMAVVDGRGADRIADALLTAWNPASRTDPGR